MSRSMLLFAAGLLVTGACGRAAATGGPSAHIQRQLDALLKNRLRPEPLPMDLPSPFAIVGAGMRESVAENPRSQLTIDHASSAIANPPAMTASDADVLAACAGRLHFGGLMRNKDQLHVIINQTARKEGDLIAVEWNGAPIYLRIVRLLPGQITLRWAEAETTVKYSPAGSPDVSK